jgi:hypothetical protein
MSNFVSGSFSSRHRLDYVMTVFIKPRPFFFEGGLHASGSEVFHLFRTYLFCPSETITTLIRPRRDLSSNISCPCCLLSQRVEIHLRRSL